METLELYARTYPNDNAPTNNLTVGYRNEGDFEKAVERGRDTVRLESSYAAAYTSLAFAYFGANRPEEAQQTLQQALERFPDNETLHYVAHFIALALGKTEDAARELAWSRGKKWEYRFLLNQVRAMQEQGKLRTSEQITQQILDIGKNQNLPELAEGDLGWLAMVQADFGFCDRALKNMGSLGAISGRSTITFAGYVFATCGQVQKAEIAAAKLNKEYPLNSFTQKSEIPQIRARIALQRGNAAQAIRASSSRRSVRVWRRRARHPRILARHGLSQKQAGRRRCSRVPEGTRPPWRLWVDTILCAGQAGAGTELRALRRCRKAGTTYQDFFSVWKDADPDIPILKEAKAEYARLQ